MSSSGDYLEAMAENTAAHNREMEQMNKAHKTQNNPLLKKAGLKPQRRKAFRKKNPDADAIYNQTYQQMDDVELRKQFASDDKKVIAAMAIATQRLAKNNQINADNIDQLDSQLINDNFKAHYEEALKDIDEGLVDINGAPEKFLALSCVDEIDKKKEEQRINKKSKASGKVNLVETVVKCKTKTCRLTEFQLKLAPPRDGAGSSSLADLWVKPDERARSDMNEKLDAAVSQDESSSGLIANILESTEAVDSFHFTGGYLNFFQRNFEVAVKGECGFGDDAHCPTVDIECSESHIDKLKKHSHQFRNTDSGLKNLRLNPPEFTMDSDEDSVKKIIRLLQPKMVNQAPAGYSLSLTSCSDSGVEMYSGFNPEIYIHQAMSAKMSVTLEYNLTKSKMIPGIEFAGRFDNTDYKVSLDPQSLVKDARSAISDLFDQNVVVEGLLKAGKVYHKLFDLGKTDEEAGDETPTEPNDAASCEVVQESSSASTDAKFLSPKLNLSYLIKKVNRPDLNYSQIGYDQSIFLSASPLMKLEKEICLFNLLWRKSIRGSIAIISAGTSEAALYALNKIDVDQNIQNTFKHFVIFMKSAVVSAAKESAVYQKMMGSERTYEKMAEEIDKVTDEEATEYCAKKSQRTLACKLKFSVAAETDDPEAGLVLSKKSGEDKFTCDKEKSTIYAGINAKLEGEMSSDLKIIKALGFGSSLYDGGGIRGEILSADRSGESRLGYTIGYNPEVKSEGKVIAQGEGLCYQRFYSGLSVYIEAFVWFTKSETGAEETGLTEAPKAHGGRGEDDDELVDDNTADAVRSEKKKTLMDFNIIPAIESPFVPIKSIFSGQIEK